jgi:hypothetical protein
MVSIPGVRTGWYRRLHTAQAKKALPVSFFGFLPLAGAFIGRQCPKVSARAQSVHSL